MRQGLDHSKASKGLLTRSSVGVIASRYAPGGGMILGGYRPGGRDAGCDGGGNCYG